MKSWSFYAAVFTACLMSCGDSSSGSESDTGADTSDANAADAPSSDGAFDSEPSDATPIDGHQADSGSGSDTPPTLQGYGTESSFGVGGDTCVVTTLEDSGPGSLRTCIEDREGPIDNPTPRVVTFEVAGTITLLSDLVIRQPYLTIDGLSAPSPGITLAKTGNGEDGETIINTWRRNNTCGHDVLVQGIRFAGVWTRDTVDHSQHAGLLSVDGEDLPGCLHHVVIWRNVYVDGQDSAGSIWGSVTDMTFAYNLVLYSYHPQSISHWPGGVEGQERQRLSLHHNVYAWSTERIPNIRGNTWDTNIEQNIMHRWASADLGSGYAMQLRCREGGCPMRINLIANHFTSATSRPEGALVFNADADPAQVYSRGNRFPSEETDNGTAATEFPRPVHAEVTLVDEGALVEGMLPWVGLATRTAEEESVFVEIATALSSEGG